MSTKHPTDDKRTGYNQLTHQERRALQQRAMQSIARSGATYIGRDRDGRIHFIDPIHGGVAVFDHAGDTDPLVILPADCGATVAPGAWAAHVEQARGPWRECRVDDRRD